MSVTPRPKVSVVTITYNHEAFIEQALESILAQETDFPVELVVADDASTDATAGIVREVAGRYPDRVVPLLRPHNLGIHANFVSALEATRGHYVALCEGDDYWTDPRKLQRQADLLDARPDVALCAHPVLTTWEGGEEPDVVWPTESERADLSYAALLRGNFVPTNSTLARRLDSYAMIPDILPLDWYVHLLHARGGPIAMIEETMGVYRRHPGGVWYGSYGDPDAFWIGRAHGMAGFADAVIALVGDDEEQRAAIQDWTLWVARLFAVRSRTAPAEETAAVLAAHPGFASLLARAFADRVDDVEWLKGQLEERDGRVAELTRKLRRARRRLEQAEPTGGSEPAPRRTPRWRPGS
ncbi:glycosyltransferase [Nocardioides zeicaulis]